MARFLTQQTALDTQPPTSSPPGGRRGEVDERRLRRGDVLLVDEASMLATADLAALTIRAKAAGARLVLVGDPAQIGAIRAPGGMLEHLAGLIPARVVELSGLHRFTHRWEAAATLAPARRRRTDLGHLPAARPDPSRRRRGRGRGRGVRPLAPGRHRRA